MRLTLPCSRSTVVLSSARLPSVRRPVASREQLVELGQQIIRCSTVDFVSVKVQHTAQFVTRLANGRILSSDDGDLVSVELATMVGGPPAVTIITNQLDKEVLLAGLKLCEELHRTLPTYTPNPNSGRPHDVAVQDTPVAVDLWHDATIEAMTVVRTAVIPDIVQQVRRQGLEAAGFLGLMARAEATVFKDGNAIFTSEETDCEINVIARDVLRKSFGWGGEAVRDWSQIDCKKVTEHAITMAELGRNPVAIEPGRRTAILTPAALAPMLAYFSIEFDASDTKHGETALSKSRRGGVKWGERVLDPRFVVSSNPADPDGGFRPYFTEVQASYRTPPMVWIENGVLKNLAFSVGDAMEVGKDYAEVPYSFRMSGGDSTVDQMIAQCKEGILVNRVAEVDLLDKFTCLLTGTTHGGCFLIEDGRISKPVKNFRFLDSPFFFLNNVEALGRPERAPFGYLHDTQFTNWSWGWPRPPVIVPPVMVRDFNFNQLVDAV